jgi:uncharacterized protein
MKKLLLAAALAAVATPALPESPAGRPDADPAVWAVRDDDTTIYLFGTFHLLDGRHDWFNEEVRAAFDRSSELVLEFVPPDDPAALQPLIARYAIDASGRPLSQRLPAPLASRLGAKLSELGMPANSYEALEPWFAVMTLVNSAAARLGITGENGTETILMAAARERRMPVGGVETVESQLEILDSMPPALQVEQLDQTLGDLDRLSAIFGPMTEAWAAGDAERVFQIMHAHLRGTPDLYRAMMVDRNARWTGWIRERMARPGTVFLAVGTGHLAGPDSVQAMLARHGLHAERVH